jgi:hypothetical protein
MKTLDLKKIAAANPDVDLETVREAIRELDALRKTGTVREKEYELESPFSRTIKERNVNDTMRCRRAK